MKRLSKQLTLGTLMAILLVASMGLLACAAKPFPVTGNNIEATVGQQFAITIESNQTTGYQWQLANPLNESIVKLVGSEYKAPKSGLVGQGGQEVWTFKAVGKGTTQIALKYVRPWEKDTPPNKQQTFTLTVK